jgi:hypothetical protein
MIFCGSIPIPVFVCRPVPLPCSVEACHPGPRRRRLRSVVARTVIFALLLPAIFSLGAPDPDWFLGLAPADGEAAAHAGHHHGVADGEKDYSEIPGSPGHPPDHNCNPCQVLKYLASYLPQLPLALPASAPSAFPPIVREEAQRAGHSACLPPSRAPPPAV